MMIPIDDIQPDMVIAGGPDRIPCTVLRTEDSVETVAPLAGRPCIKVWIRREDTGEEGYVLYGPNGYVEIFTNEGPDDDEWINRIYQSGACGNERTATR
jgi:hypothetical protein